MERAKYILCLVLCALIGVAAARADLRVKSFSELNDLDARLLNPIIDPKTGQNCPIVKIITTYDGFNFDIGAMGAPEKVVYKKEMGEIWLYLPVKSAKLKIAHPRYGQFVDDSNTRNGYFWFPQARLKSSTSYRLVLEVRRGTIELDDEEQVKTGYVVIDSEPQGADVYVGVDEVSLEYVGQTPFQKRYEYGTYSYALKKNMYHCHASSFSLKEPKIVAKIPLNPAFGNIHITSQPVGAKVVIDGIDGEYVTPFTSGNLKSGDYTVRLTLDRYSPSVRHVTVTDGAMAELAVTLAANYAALTVASLPGAQISINGAVAGTGSVVQELTEGLYEVEASLPHHRPVKKQVEVVANVPQSIELNPTPIYGSLSVMTTPYDADVTIGGKNYGKTPLDINRLLEGEYDVMLSKPGYATVTRHVTIAEKQTASIDATLSQGRRVNFTGTAGATLAIDGVALGTLPCSREVAIGTHTVRIEHGGKSAEKQLTVQQGTGEVAFAISIGVLKPKWSPSVTASQRAVLEPLVENMVRVEGGTFTMGATAEQGGDAEADEKPAHQVTLSDYYIGKYEVTQAEWEAVMGKNPVEYDKGDNRPVQNVSWDDCQDFINKLNSLTGLNFSLPTEAQWEYAARGGNKSRGYKYSGSNEINAVGWCNTNSGKDTHPVGTKQANELGLYDMSGNVWEWCNDWSGSYSSGSQTNPTGPARGSSRVIRGGSSSWKGLARFCRVSHRDDSAPDVRDYDLGLRLAVRIEQGGKSAEKHLMVQQGTGEVAFAIGLSPVWKKGLKAKKRAVLERLVENMVWVEGGTFTMEVPAEQGGDAEGDEKPAHQVTLSDYYRGKYEVTQAEWEAVMGEAAWGRNPSYHKGNNRPVEQVSWEDCERFINELNRLTGLNFSLPTEAQWEYAARGGNKSRGYKYSGSNEIDAVAWYHDSSCYETHPVGTKQPNELGLYDMSGNVWEWCSDEWYGTYSQTYPTDSAIGSNCVIRDWYGCQVSSRVYANPDDSSDFIGLRLVVGPQ